MSDGNAPQVIAVARDGQHRFSKATTGCITLLAGLGVEGDAHAGETVQHLSRVCADHTQPNLRQVHLIHAELFDELADHGFSIVPGALGENITTRGIDLSGLPRGTVLRIGDQAELEVAGLRNPCGQIEAFAPGLLARVARKRTDGSIERLAGIMSVVRQGGEVRPGDAIAVEIPPKPHHPLERV